MAWAQHKASFPLAIARQPQRSLAQARASGGATTSPVERAAVQIGLNEHRFDNRMGGPFVVSWICNVSHPLSAPSNHARVGRRTRRAIRDGIETGGLGLFWLREGLADGIHDDADSLSQLPRRR